jgi:hypothetical protein
MYDSGYREAVEALRAYVDGFENLKTFGRNGLHRYNNQDHSMWTAILAALNLVDGAGYDVWAVNTEQEYLEEGAAVEAALDVELAPVPREGELALATRGTPPAPRRRARRARPGPRA